MKWEYHFTNVEYPDNVAGKHKKVELLNEFGLEGWELVSVDNGIAYFKRPIKPKFTGIQMQVKSGYRDAIVKSSASQAVEFPVEQQSETSRRYSYDTVQDGYVVYDNRTMVKLSGFEVETLLNND